MTQAMFHIRAESGEPIYLQLIRQIKHAVTAGILPAGTQMPTVRQLAADLVINPNTVARAYRDLFQEGVLECTQGRGTFVKLAPSNLIQAEKARRMQSLLDQLIAEARLLGISDKQLQEQLKESLRQYAQQPSTRTER
jgi:GntR family transcriptional regulator